MIGAFATVTSVSADAYGMMQSSNLRNLDQHDGYGMEEGSAYSPSSMTEVDEDESDEQEDGPGVIEDTMGNETLGNRRGRPRRQQYRRPRPQHYRRRPFHGRYVRRGVVHGGINCHWYPLHQWCRNRKVIIR